MSRTEAKTAEANTTKAKAAQAQAPWRYVRWTAAFLVVVVAMGVVALTYLNEDLAPCQTETVSRPQGGAGQRGATIVTEKRTCEPVRPMDALPLLIPALILLAPEFARIRVGFFELERLGEKVERQEGEISQLRAQVASMATATAITNQVMFSSASQAAAYARALGETMTTGLARPVRESTSLEDLVGE